MHKPPGSKELKMRSEKIEDNILIRKSKRGDCESFKRLFEKYSSRVYSVAYRYMHSADDSLDVVQDVFLSMYRNLRSFRAGSDFYPWIRRMTVNACIDRLRAKKRRPKNRPLFPEGENAARPAEDDPANLAQAHELEELLAESVGHLSETHRQVIRLYSVDQLGYREIAKVMRCSIGTVMSRLHYARKKLSEELEEYIASPA
ncbi:MAG: RNA polymerase sigma factor [Planctomycetota bacterium]|jgi:RNA polymerase sigma-70 factor (ECF subfamily)